MIAVFLFLNAMIGSGFLNQPYVFYLSGILGALILYIPATSFTWVGLVMLTEACVKDGSFEYEQSMKNTFGRGGEIALAIGVLFYFYGAQLSYFIIIGSTLSSLTTSWGCTSEVCNQYFMTLIPAIVVVLPINLFKHYGELSLVSVFSMFSIGSIILLVVS